jgi:hypothetical protein
MPTMKDTSNHEALGGMSKKKAPMAHTSPGSTSHPEETLGGKPKRKVPPAHVGAKSTSHEEETLCQMPKKKPSMVNPGGGYGDAASAV